MAPAAWADNLVMDGSFETPVISGTLATITAPGTIGPWDVTNGSVDQIGTLLWDAADGAQSLDLSGLVAGTIRQNIPTDTDYTYNLRFAMSGNWFAGNLTQKTMEVYWGGTLVGSIAMAQPSGWSFTNMQWQDYWITGLPVTGSLTELKFVSMEDNSYGPALDNVYLEAVPEPGTLALLALGLPAFAWWRKRKWDK